MPKTKQTIKFTWDPDYCSIISKYVPNENRGSHQEIKDLELKKMQYLINGSQQRDYRDVNYLKIILKQSW